MGEHKGAGTMQEALNDILDALPPLEGKWHVCCADEPTNSNPCAPLNIQSSSISSSCQSSQGPCSYQFLHFRPISCDLPNVAEIASQPRSRPHSACGESHAPCPSPAPHLAIGTHGKPGPLTE